MLDNNYIFIEECREIENSINIKHNMDYSSKLDKNNMIYKAHLVNGITINKEKCIRSEYSETYKQDIIEIYLEKEKLGICFMTDINPFQNKVCVFSIRNGKIEKSLEIEPHLLYSIIEQKGGQKNRCKSSIRNHNVKEKYMREMHNFSKQLENDDIKDHIEIGLSIIKENLETLIEELSAPYELSKRKRKVRKI